MKADFSEIDFSQDLGPLFKFFYPGAEVLCRTGINAVSGNDAFSGNIKSEINISGEAENADFEAEELYLFFDTRDEEFKIYLNGRQEVSEKVDFLGTTDVEESVGHIMPLEKVRRRDYKNQLMRAVYRILEKRTGKSLPWGTLTGVRPTKLCFDRLEKGLEDNVTHMRETYYCSEKKAVLAEQIAKKELRLLQELDYKNGYSLYVGFPFCPSICNYCSFGSHPTDRFGHLIEPYIEALLHEIDECAGLIRDLKLETVYFGGGTPTAVSAEQLARVIKRVKERFDFSNVKEFSVEAGRPDCIDAEKLQVLKDAGVTRISINPQSMRQKTLDIIGRRHTAEKTVEAFRLARSMGFDDINMDIIAGLSGECLEDMKYTLDEIAKLDPESITVHTLALKRAARLTTEKENFAGCEASEVPEMVEYAADFCKKHGYEPYYLYRQKNMTENLENVGYAKPGKEGLYNILIMEEQQMILALGAGSSSKFTDYRYLEKLRKLENGCSPLNDAELEAGPIIRRFGRVENVKAVGIYIDQIDEMIKRKREFLGVDTEKNQ
ncbi:MAG: coproporphyrinogen dehydrogenase HemZ [Lachnospiraceae bacterium]|nr:coproporphyrinogen dehydrogenase HemZ [Lachnospiraceae bacterium]